MYGRLQYNVFMVTIGPLHRQKLILAIAKAQPIWDLLYCYNLIFQNCRTSSSLWWGSSLCQGLDIVKFDMKLGHRKVFPSVSQWKAWKPWSKHCEHRTEPSIFQFPRKTWIELLWKHSQVLCNLGVMSSSPAFSSVFSKFFLFLSRISFSLCKFILWCPNIRLQWEKWHVSPAFFLWAIYLNMLKK